MTKLEQWICSIVISFIISILMAVLSYKAEIKEWYIMSIISFILGTLLTKLILFLSEGNLWLN